MANGPDFDLIFSSANLSILFFGETVPREFKLFSEFRDLFKKELKFWSKSPLPDIYNLLRNVVTQIEQMEIGVDKADENQFRNYLNQLPDIVKSLNNKIIHSESELAKFINNLYVKSKQRAQGAYGYIVTKRIPNIHEELRDREYFAGMFAGLTYLEVDENFKTQMKATEESHEEAYLKVEKFISEKKSAIKKIIFQIEDEALKAISEQKGKIEEVSTKFIDDKRNWESNIKKLKGELENRIKGFDGYVEESKKNIKNLEKSYDEQLKLEAPSKYWKTLCGIYEKKGKSWRNLAILSSCIVVFVLILILYWFPSWIISSDGNWTQALKGTILVSVIISIGVYIIRLFVKLSTSDYHLSRDALERRNLTLYFLALIKKGALKSEEKEIILQSVFSRADTGLIKGDSIPKMSKIDLLKIFKMGEG